MDQQCSFQRIKSLLVLLQSFPKNLFYCKIEKKDREDRVMNHSSQQNQKNKYNSKNKSEFDFSNNAHLHTTLKTSDVMAKNRVSEVAYRNNKISC